MEEILKEISSTLKKFDWVNFLLSLTTIAISLTAIIISVKSDAKNSKRDAKVTLMELRLKFYTDCIDTFNSLKGSIIDLLSPNPNIITKIMYDVENQEIKLMKCTNTCKFLFEEDETIYNTIKTLYSKYNLFKNLLFDAIVNNTYQNEFNKFLKQQQINIKNLSTTNIKELLILANKFGKENNIEVLNVSEEIKNILSNDEFDNMFKKYINTH